MFDWFSNKKLISHRPKEKSLAEIKAIARILVIDDRESQLTTDLKNENWKVTYIKDLDSYSDSRLLDTHVICLDIKGVGKTLRCESGLGLVKGIKEKYPAKKILLYSSVRDHDIFDEAVELVDRRIFKDGQPYQFIKGVEDLAKEALSWKKCSEATFEKFKSEFGVKLTYEEFEEKIITCVNPDSSVSEEKILQLTACGVKIAKIISEYLTIAAKN